MNHKFILIYLWLSIPFVAFSQGTSCANSISLSLDGVLRSYPTSSATGNNVLCTNNGTTPVTWFKFTSNARGECPLLNITVSDSSACEVAFYSSCSSMLASSSMCFYSGYGLWAPNENLVIAANTTYYLRVKTASACSIKIAGQYFSPPNDDCFGALSLSNINIADNNACDHAGPGVTPSQLCALTLENTAWYQFYILTTGYGVINITNIHCNNGASNNNSGFQIGFFKGNCNALEWLNCTNGSGTTIQATTTQLPEGTKVYVAIDGISGSNCSYRINGLNIIGVLAGNIKHFSGWKTDQSNILKWTTLHESGGYYQVERASNGIDFSPIGRINSRSSGNENVQYDFEDTNPSVESYYRLKQFDAEGKQAISNIIYIERKGSSAIQINMNNPAAAILNLRTGIEFSGKYSCSIFNIQGQKVASFYKIFAKGNNQFPVDISVLPAGQYSVVIENEISRANKMFVKF
jgi:Secretion system C-terminal sorting domain